MVNQQVTTRRKSRIRGVAWLCCLFIMLVTPKIPFFIGTISTLTCAISSVPPSFKPFISLSYAISFHHVHNTRPCSIWLFFVLSIRVPNTLNVITNFPFLIVGVLGFVLSLGGGSFFFLFNCCL